MFSLIVTLIAIALVAGLALASVYYGGSVFNRGGDAAKVALLLNESTQIRTAAELHKAAMGSYAPDIETLISSSYLSAAPSAGTWSLYQNSLAVSGVSQKVCEELNARHGITGVPPCSDAADDTDSICCEMS